jgi:hypothetical protein
VRIVRIKAARGRRSGANTVLLWRETQERPMSPDRGARLPRTRGQVGGRDGGLYLPRGAPGMAVTVVATPDPREAPRPV